MNAEVIATRQASRLNSVFSAKNITQIWITIERDKVFDFPSPNGVRCRATVHFQHNFTNATHEVVGKTFDELLSNIERFIKEVEV